MTKKSLLNNHINHIKYKSSNVKLLFQYITISLYNESLRCFFENCVNLRVKEVQFLLFLCTTLYSEILCKKVERHEKKENYVKVLTKLHMSKTCRDALFLWRSTF